MGIQGTQVNFIEQKKICFFFYETHFFLGIQFRTSGRDIMNSIFKCYLLTCFILISDCLNSRGNIINLVFIYLKKKNKRSPRLLQLSNWHSLVSSKRVSSWEIPGPDLSVTISVSDCVEWWLMWEGLSHCDWQHTFSGRAYPQKQTRWA